MKLVLPGGTGHVGTVLAKAFHAEKHEVVVLSRREGVTAPWRVRQWDGETAGPWIDDLDGADVVVNLAGRSVDCRYTEANRRAIMRSRVDSTHLLGRAIADARRPPAVWLQASTATIYAHRFDAANDEATGIIGGDEPDAPGYWRRSIDIAKAWERALDEANTPKTRKVALRTAMVLSPDGGGVLDVLLGLTRFGIGGSIAGGRQYMSWIHERDFVRAVDFLVERTDFTGAVNVASPAPIPQSEFMKALRDATGVRIGLPATKWMVQIGAVFMRTDTELVLKSRRVVPKRLLDAGFRFEFPEWPEAAKELVARLGERGAAPR